MELQPINDQNFQINKLKYGQKTKINTSLKIGMLNKDMKNKTIQCPNHQGTENYNLANVSSQLDCVPSVKKVM